jgi:benzoyl-CoA reductase/2-hydroxyglutaryl-CoA dehydratase subunit BcrC/BadD/HgdB
VSALEQLIASYDHPPVPESGVVGYVGADVPRELIVAAGLHPLRVKGSVPVTSRRADEILGPGVAAPVRAVLAGLLDGRPRLDFLLVSHESDSTVRLFTALRALPEPLPELWFVDLLHLPTETTAEYNRARIRDLIRVLEGWSGRNVADEDIQAAKRDAATTERLLDRLSELRREGRIAGSDAIAAAGGASNLPGPEAHRLLEELLTERRAAPPSSGRRVFVTGSEPDRGLYRGLEASGLQVVEDPYDADVALAWIRSGDDALAWRLPGLALDVPLVVLDRREDASLTADELALLG